MNNKGLKRFIALLASLGIIFGGYTLAKRGIGGGGGDTDYTEDYSDYSEETTEKPTEVQDEFISYSEAINIAEQNMPDNAQYHDYRDGDAGEFKELTAEQVAPAIVLYGNDGQEEEKIAKELYVNYNEANNSIDPKSIYDALVGFLACGGDPAAIMPNSKSIKELSRLIKSGVGYPEINAKIEAIAKNDTARAEVVAITTAVANVKNMAANYEHLKLRYNDLNNSQNAIAAIIAQYLESYGVEPTVKTK